MFGRPKGYRDTGSLNLEQALIIALLVLVAAGTLVTMGSAIACAYAKEAASVGGVVPEPWASACDLGTPTATFNVNVAGAGDYWSGEMGVLVTPPGGTAPLDFPDADAKPLPGGAIPIWIEANPAGSLEYGPNRQVGYQVDLLVNPEAVGTWRFELVRSVWMLPDPEGSIQVIEVNVTSAGGTYEIAFPESFRPTAAFSVSVAGAGDYWPGDMGVLVTPPGGTAPLDFPDADTKPLPGWVTPIWTEISPAGSLRYGPSGSEGYLIDLLSAPEAVGTWRFELVRTVWMLPDPAGVLQTVEVEVTAAGGTYEIVFPESFRVSASFDVRVADFGSFYPGDCRVRVTEPGQPTPPLDGSAALLTMGWVPAVWDSASIYGLDTGQFFPWGREPGWPEEYQVQLTDYPEAVGTWTFELLYGWSETPDVLDVIQVDVTPTGGVYEVGLEVPATP